MTMDAPSLVSDPTGYGDCCRDPGFFGVLQALVAAIAWYRLFSRLPLSSLSYQQDDWLWCLQLLVMPQPNHILTPTPWHRVS